MNSPSSSETMLHPIRMWRFSDSDLYWLAMNTRRSPELMQLLRAKSIMRYGPPKYTAGLARSRVSGKSRSPAPPASTMTRVSSRSADIVPPPSALPQHDARGCAVRADHRQRKTVHLVDARLDVAQVQAFDHDRASSQQNMMRRRAGRFERLNRQVVDADQFDATLDEIFRRRLTDPDVLLVKRRVAPQARVGCLDEDAHIVGQV